MISWVDDVSAPLFLRCVPGVNKRWNHCFYSLLSILTVILLLSGCENDLLIQADCEGDGQLSVICGVDNPEDLVRIPGENLIIVSEFILPKVDEVGEGRLSVLNTVTQAITPLAPRLNDQSTPEKKSKWGDPKCKRLTDNIINPHGMDLSVRPDGKLQLLVVNHAYRESVEFFEVDKTGPDIALIWKGCAIPPKGSELNDVVALQEGGFLVTHTGTDMASAKGIFNMVKAMLGINIGYVIEWSLESGFSAVPGTNSRFPNGIQLSADGEIIYLNEYMGNKVKKINRHTGVLEAEISVTRPDNISWDENGGLLVASQNASTLDMLSCHQKKGYSCITKFEIISIDPTSFEYQTILKHDGPPFGAATVAIRVDEKIYLGTYVGDRIAVATMNADQGRHF